MAYLQQTDSAESERVSLHLAVCTFCREQVTTMTRLKSSAAILSHDSCNEGQQQWVDDFIYGQLSDSQKKALRSRIKEDPVALKSALHSLSVQSNNNENVDESLQLPEPYLTTVKNWMQSLTGSWLAIPATVVATLLVSVVTFQVMGLISEQSSSIMIASYQDNKKIRFLAHNKMPGIGFFSSANEHSEPYQNLTISLNEKQQLQLEWQPVKYAENYDLSLSSFSEGFKVQRDKITTSQTRAIIKLTEVDFNRRFEWTLSGKTIQGKTFIASGGFIISREKP